MGWGNDIALGLFMSAAAFVTGPEAQAQASAKSKVKSDTTLKVLDGSTVIVPKTMILKDHTISSVRTAKQFGEQVYWVTQEMTDAKAAKHRVVIQANSNEGQLSWKNIAALTVFGEHTQDQILYIDGEPFGATRLVKDNIQPTDEKALDQKIKSSVFHLKPGVK